MLIELSLPYVRMDVLSLRCALGVVILHRDKRDGVRVDADEGTVTKFDDNRTRELHLLKPLEGQRSATFQIGTTVGTDHNNRFKLSTRREGSVTLLRQRDHNLWEVVVSLREYGSDDITHMIRVAGISPDYNPRFDFQGDQTAWGRLLEDDPFEFEGA